MTPEEIKETIKRDLEEIFVGMKNTEFNRKLMKYEIEAQMERFIIEGKLKL